MNIGDRLRELRKSRRLTQREVAAMAGLSAGHYANVESGTTGIKDAPLLLISKELQASFKWLKTGVGDRDLSRETRIMAMREDRASYQIPPPKDWAEKLQAIIDRDRAKFDYAISMGVPLPKILGDLADQIMNEVDEDHE